ESDPGPLLQAESDRSRQAEDEPGADGALQGARRQPCERLRADAIADARAAGDVGPALHGDRTARRAVLRLDPRPLGARSVLRGADPHGCEPALAAEADTVGGRRA